MFADKGRCSRIRIPVSVTNIVIGNQKQSSEVWNQANSVAFSIQLDSSREEQAWVDVGGTNCLLNIQPPRKEPDPKIPCLNWCPVVPWRGTFIPVIPFWAKFLGSIAGSVVVCRFRTSGPDLNIKVFLSLGWSTGLVSMCPHDGCCQLRELMKFWCRN